MVSNSHMEVIDVVSKNDEIIGKALKREIYDKKLLHRIIHVLIFNKKGDMLLQMRGNVSYCPFHWSTSVGGHVKSGESCKDAALREYKEELGANSPIEFFSKDFFKGTGGPDKFLYTFKSVYDGPFNPDKKDVEKIGFFSIKGIEKMIKNGEKFHPELLFLLRKHFFAKPHKRQA
jgi:isopentenyldiphosphate isomerase